MFGKRTVVLWEALLSSSDISVQQYFSLCRKEIRENRIDSKFIPLLWVRQGDPIATKEKKLPPEFRRRTRKSPRISRAHPENRLPNSQTKHGGKSWRITKTCCVIRDGADVDGAFKQPSKGHSYKSYTKGEEKTRLSFYIMCYCVGRQVLWLWVCSVWAILVF